MALYYPPKEGLKGWRPQHWPDSAIPENLGDAILSAKAIGEAIYNSDNQWLILDDFGRPPSAINMEWQPLSQLKFTGWYGVQQKAPTPITITEGRTFIPGVAMNPNRWFSDNWYWAVPIGIGLLGLLIAKKK